VGKSIIDTSSVTRVGLDLAKRVFRIHAVDATGSVVIARSINRRTLLKFFDPLPRCVVAMEPAPLRITGGDNCWNSALR
jgi:transposase